MNEDDYLDKIEFSKPVKNKHIERIKKQELYSSGISGISGISDDFYKRGVGSNINRSSSDIGGSNSGNTSKDNIS
jgi:hypothetical protein